jgi:hypothetical protein
MSYYFENNFCENIATPFCQIEKSFNPVLELTEERLEELKEDAYFWHKICYNPSAMHLIEKNIDKINWFNLSSNTSAIELLERFPENIDYGELSRNSNAVHILKRNLDKVNWEYLSLNKGAVSILEKNLDKVHWDSLSLNPSAIKILRRNLDKVNWEMFSRNIYAVPTLREHLDKVDWNSLCQNESPEAIELLLEFPEKINKNNWLNLCENPFAIDLMLDNLDKCTTHISQRNPLAFRYEALIDPTELNFGAVASNPNLSEILHYFPFDLYNPDITDVIYLLDNPGVFSEINYCYDFDVILRANYYLHEEFHAWAGHPLNLRKSKDWGFDNGIEEEAQEAQVEEVVEQFDWSRWRQNWGLRKEEEEAEEEEEFMGGGGGGVVGEEEI